MKVTCLQENLSKGLSIVSRAVSTRSTLPVLANVLLETDNGRLKLSATNLEIVITCWLGSQVAEDGAITVPARTFSDLVNNLPPEPIELSLDEQTQTLHLDCKNSQSNIKGIDYQEFPLVPDPSSDGRIKIGARILKEMISQVAFAAATDDTRPILTGISTNFADNTATMAATDGFRLSVRHAQLEQVVASDPLQVIIPARSLNEVARVISEDMDEVFISMPEGRNQVIFDMKSVVIVSQLIDGAFPDFTAVLPKRHLTRTVLNTGELIRACKRANIFAREASHTARIKIVPGDEITPGQTTITATSTETGDNEAQLDASVIGDPVEIAFNVKYMIEVLNVINTPQVAIETTTALEPGVLKPIDENTNFTHVIMPMHFGQ